MIYIVANLWAILLATAGSLAVGALYVAAVGRRRVPPVLVVAAALAEFWLTAILAGAVILAPPRADPWTMALGSAVVIWIGFVVPTLVVTHLSRGLPLRSAAADCGHWLAAMGIEAVILHLVGLTPPG